MSIGAELRPDQIIDIAKVPELAPENIAVKVPLGDASSDLPIEMSEAYRNRVILVGCGFDAIPGEELVVDVPSVHGIIYGLYLYREMIEEYQLSPRSFFSLMIIEANSKGHELTMPNSIDSLVEFGDRLLEIL